MVDARDLKSLGPCGCTSSILVPGTILMQHSPIIFIFVSLSTLSQPWPGYNTSKYTGIHGLSYQTEIHSVMPSDWDINVLSTNLTFFNENFFGIDPVKNLTNGNINDVSDISKDRNGLINAYVQFPSVAYRINEKSTVGFSWRLRAALISNVSNDELSEFINKIQNPSGEPASFVNDFARGFLSTWSQYSFLYSRELFRKNEHKLFGGISLNILSGGGSAYLDITNMSFTYSDEVLSDVDLTFRMVVSEEVDAFVNDQELPLFSRIGFGTDFGLTYMKTKDTNSGYEYDYKFGFNVIGLGSVNYNASMAPAINVKADEISRESFNGIGSFQELQDTLVSLLNVDNATSDKITSRMPLDISIYGDFHIYKRFYLHAAYTRQITYFGKVKFDDLSFNNYYIVPRYESKKIGVYLPFTYNKILNLESGVAFRWKPLVIGSGNIISALFQGGERTNIDLYLTTRIMLNRKKK